LKKALINI